MALSDAAPFAVAHWSLDEASGTRADSVGSSDLTDVNTVGSAAGKFSNAADFESGSSEYLTVNDNADVTGEDVDITLRMWVKIEDKGATNQVVAGVWYSSVNKRSYALFYLPGSDRFAFIVSSNGTTSTTATANNFGAPTAGTWYLVHCWHDATSNEIGISVNAGTANTASHSGGAFNTDAPFRLGSEGVGGNYFDGCLDDVVLLKGYVLDATERTEDYNSGTGVAFADWDAAAGLAIPIAAYHYNHHLGSMA